MLVSGQAHVPSGNIRRTAVPRSEVVSNLQRRPASSTAGDTKCSLGIFGGFFETCSHSAVPAGLELTAIVLLQFAEGWDCRCAPPWLASVHWFLKSPVLHCLKQTTAL